MTLRSYAWIVLALALVMTAGGVLAEDRSSLIALRSGNLDIRQPKAVSDELAVFSAEAGSEDLVLVKFPGPVSAQQLADLTALVERVYTYLPHDAFLVRLAPEKQAALTSDLSLGLAWQGPFQPAYKISPSIGLVARSTASKSSRPRVMLLHVLPDADVSALIDEIDRLGLGEVVGSGLGSRFARVRLLVEGRRLEQVAARLALKAGVFFIDVEPRRTLLNDTTVWVAQSGTSGGQATPIWDRGVLGEGQIVGVLDTGIDIDMCYFRDPALGLPPTNPCNGGILTNPAQRKVIAVDFLWGNECSGGISSNEWDTQDHGSHVAGTIAGDNFANLLSHDAGDGVAPGAKLVVQDCGYQVDNCADCPGIGACPVVDLNPVFQQAFDQGARIHSNSWGDDENNPVQALYSAGSQDADEFMWNHPDFLLVFAAGNSGPGTGTVGSPSTAKNVVAVGATLRSTSAGNMASFSSCGPTDDGRIKPDVTMPGSGIISANADNNINSNNCNTKSSSGTSMATPGTAGALALIRQYYTDGFYPSGAAVPANAFVPTGALLKATLINSAVDMSGVAAIPSNCQGWGRVLLDDALSFTGENRDLFVEDDRTGFPNGSSSQTRTFQLQVASSSEPLKVTLAWTDYPSTPAASTHLVNDLDLEVTGPSGTFRGNVFSGGTSTTGGSFDRLNSVEQVLIATPTPGTYTVTVRSFTVPSGPQPFSVVATADLGVPGNTAPSVSITAPASGTTVTVGASVAFSGTATDVEDGNLGASIAWSSSIDGSLGGGASINTSALSVGTHTITASVTDSGGLPGSDQITLTVQGAPGSCLHDVDFESGAGGWTQGTNTCTTGSFVVGVPDATTWQVGGGNPQNAFFTRNNAGGLGTDDVDGGTCEALSPAVNASAEAAVSVTLDYFHGQRDTGGDSGDGFSIEVLNNSVVVDTLVSIGDVTTNPVWTTVSTTVNNPGTLQVRVRASDATAGGDIVEGGVDNIRICPVTPSTCSLEDDFESGTPGWSNSSASTCSTGAYIEGNPTQQSNGGVITQVGGSHSGTKSIFTASNSSAGSNDVDGGNCILDSPTWSVSSASTLSAWYFHGQRDAGGDSGDFFRLEYSLDGGTVWSTMASNGDATSNAVWTQATASIPAGSNVKLRVQCSDGTSNGDLVECGLDDVSICTNP